MKWYDYAKCLMADKKIKQDDLLETFGVKTYNGLVDESDLYHQLHSWILAKVSSKEIEITEPDN